MFIVSPRYDRVGEVRKVPANLTQREDGAQANLQLLVLQLPDGPIEKLGDVVLAGQRSLANLGLGLLVGDADTLQS